MRNYSEIYQELFGKYSAYRMDSALWAANRCVEVAQRMPVASHLYSARMRVAEVMIGTGMYKEGPGNFGRHSPGGSWVR
ncbi:hypothetical protein NXX09_11440 [Bacteroides uniformis]|nr:hypothetical protein [Bacteroides uniformis]